MWYWETRICAFSRGGSAESPSSELPRIFGSPERVIRDLLVQPACLRLTRHTICGESLGIVDFLGVMRRLGIRREAAAGSHPGILNKYQATKLQGFFSRKRQIRDDGRRCFKVQAVLQQDRRRQESSGYADAASRPDARHQVSATTATADAYVPLDEAQDLLREVVNANSPAPPLFLPFCASGQQVRIFLKFTQPLLQEERLDLVELDVWSFMWPL